MIRPILWVHGDCLDPQGPHFRSHPQAPALWVWDEQLLAEWQLSLKRLVFIYECLVELPVVIRRGGVVAEVLTFATEHQADGIVTTASPSPLFRQYVKVLEQSLPVTILPVEPFVDYDGHIDLARFSRYWRVAQAYAFKGDLNDSK